MLAYSSRAEDQSLEDITRNHRETQVLRDGKTFFWEGGGWRLVRFHRVAPQHFNLILAQVSDVLQSPTLRSFSTSAPHNNLSERRRKIAGRIPAVISLKAPGGTIAPLE